MVVERIDLKLYTTILAGHEGYSISSYVPLGDKYLRNDLLGLISSRKPLRVIIHQIHSFQLRNSRGMTQK